MKVIAVIPAKAQSSRVPNKNFKEFYDGKSLVEIKILQCLNSGVFDKVYVSSDSDNAAELCSRHGVNFLRREPRLCVDATPWNEVLTGVLHSVPEDEDTYVAWAPATTPLFTRYADAVSLLENTVEHDSIMSVTRLQHYFLSSDMLPLNFQYGVWASYSQKLNPIYQMNCALWLARKGDMIRNRFQIGDRPGFLESTIIEGLDIDTPDEFEVAAVLYQRRANHEK